MPLHDRLSLMLLLAACGPTVERPTEAELATCDAAEWPDSDSSDAEATQFWDCCDVWYRDCIANRGGSDCQWICNG